MFTVISKFADKYNKKNIFQVGDVFESDEQERINDLLDRGLITGPANALVKEKPTKKRNRKSKDGE
jgi:phenylalanyl-tRNA synthetase beta subunit